MSMNLDRHINAHIAQFRALAGGDVVAADAHRKFYDEYCAVMDLPAEFYLETVQRVFQDHDLPLGKLTWHGQPVRPAAIRRTALLTVEGERDDICAIGQTMAALDLCTGVRHQPEAASSADRRRALRRVQRLALGARGLSQGAGDDRGHQPLVRVRRREDESHNDALHRVIWHLETKGDVLRFSDARYRAVRSPWQHSCGHARAERGPQASASPSWLPAEA